MKDGSTGQAVKILVFSVAFVFLFSYLNRLCDRPPVWKSVEIPSTKEQVDIVRTTLSQLGIAQLRPSFRDVRDRAAKLGLEMLSPNEVDEVQRLKPDQNHEQEYFLIMEPDGRENWVITVSFGWYPNVHTGSPVVFPPSQQTVALTDECTSRDYLLFKRL